MSVEERVESESTAERKRPRAEKKIVLSGPMSVALLDEIAERLCALQRFQEEERAEGVVEPIEPVSVNEELRHVIAPIKPWFSVNVVNDGPDDVYVMVNTEKSFDWHRVPQGESYRVDMKRGIIKDLLLKCEAGKTASVRLVGSR
jgi:hypothetical protein